MIGCLLDTGTTESYIHEELVKKLKLKSQGELSRISLASVGTSAQVRGFVLVPVKAFSYWYDLKMGVVRKLCADLILGQDFLTLWEPVYDIFVLGSIARLPVWFYAWRLSRQGAVWKGCAGKTMHARKKLPTYEIFGRSSSFDERNQKNFHLV